MYRGCPVKAKLQPLVRALGKKQLNKRIKQIQIQCPTLLGLQDTKSTVAVVKRLISLQQQVILQLGFKQNILLSLPRLANKITKKGSLPQAQLKFFKIIQQNKVYLCMSMCMNVARSRSAHCRRILIENQRRRHVYDQLINLSRFTSLLVFKTLLPLYIENFKFRLSNLFGL